MRLVIQRVKRASVSINDVLYSSIGEGMMILVGVEIGDTEVDVDWLVKKTAALRIYDDEAGVMNLSLNQLSDLEVLVVSQFTLTAGTRKGNRPSYIRAAGHDVSVPMYELFCHELGQVLGREVKRGFFGADMQVELINDGPVTIIIDSRLKE